MQIFCEQCRAPQRAAERHCLNCGKAFGGEWWVLVVGVLLAVALPGLVLSAPDQELADPRLLKILFWYEVPVIVMTAFLYDFHPRRRALYFWGGAALIVASILILVGR